MLTDEIFKLPTLHNYYHIPTKDEDNCMRSLLIVQECTYFQMLTILTISIIARLSTPCSTILVLTCTRQVRSIRVYFDSLLAADVLTFVQMLCSEGKTAGGTTVISPEAIDLMKNTFFNPFAKLKFQNNITLSIGSGG